MSVKAFSDRLKRNIQARMDGITRNMQSGLSDDAYQRATACWQELGRVQEEIDNTIGQFLQDEDEADEELDELPEDEPVAVTAELPKDPRPVFRGAARASRSIPAGPRRVRRSTNE